MTFLGFGLKSLHFAGRQSQAQTSILTYGAKPPHHLCPTPSLTHDFVHTPSLTHHLSHATLSPTIFYAPLCHRPSFTDHLSQTIFHTPLFHHLSPHHPSHTTLSHTIFHRIIFHTHTQLCRTPSFTTPSFTHNFVTQHLSPHHISHTTLSHTIFHTPLCHTLSFTHNFHTHQLSHTTLSHTHTHHLSLPHTIFHIQLGHTQLCFTSRSSTTSFVFPSLPVPATTFGAHYWKKLPCGVIRSFNYILYLKNEFFKLTEGYTPRPVSYTHSFNAKRVFACILFCSYPCFSFSFDACAFVGTMIALNLAIRGGILLFKSNFLHYCQM